MQRFRRQYSAFTLVELMVSLFMVVLLMVGINMIFKLASDTVGAGQRTIAIAQDVRSMQTTMEEDAKRWLTNAPAFVIVNELVPDLKDASILHRRDYVAFPARGLYRRQTGPNISSFVSQTGSYEAWIWYGSTYPVLSGNVPQNAQLPTDVVGRFAMLLKQNDTINNGVTDDRYRENFILRGNIALDPLAWGSISTTYGNSPRRRVEESVYDLGGTTLELFRQDVTARRQLDAKGYETNVNWWIPLDYRYQCNPKLPKPISPVGVAQATPYLVGNCSEFIVEFAGDYLDQTDYENPKLGSDGRIDYISLGGGIQKIRWYGIDRDIDGDRVINGPSDVAPVYPPPKPDNGLPYSKDLPYFQRTPQQLQRQVWVWANEAPRLIRVSVKLEDPTGRIQDGPWAEFVLGAQ